MRDRGEARRARSKENRTSELFGFEIEKRTPNRVIIRRDGEDVIDMRSVDLSGDDLVMVALNQVRGMQEAAPAGAHTIEVPHGSMAGRARTAGEEE